MRRIRLLRLARSLVLGALPTTCLCLDLRVVPGSIAKVDAGFALRRGVLRALPSRDRSAMLSMSCSALEQSSAMSAGRGLLPLRRVHRPGLPGRRRRPRLHIDDGRQPVRPARLHCLCSRRALHARSGGGLAARLLGLLMLATAMCMSCNSLIESSLWAYSRCSGMGPSLA